MAVGTEAKENLMKKIIAALGDDYLGEQSNKFYFWSEEKGQKKQVAISMTCPKILFAEDSAKDLINDWSLGDPAPTPKKPKDEIPQKELDDLADMMKRLGL